MGGFNTSLMIGVQALDASQGALSATSNNIANANTPGYTREVAQFGESPETVTGNEVSGGGVTLTGLQSVRDELLNLQIQQQTSSQQSADTQSTLLAQIQSAFSTSSSTSGDIASQLSAFSTSLSQLAATPGNSSAEQGVLSAGQNLADAFNNASNTLTSAQTAANSQVTSNVAQINSLTQQIAAINQQVGQVPAGQDGGTVEDQRDQLVQQLSSLTGLSITQTNDGETITTGNGTPLVMGDQSFNLQTTTGTGGMTQVLDSNGNNITSSLTTGSLGGAIQVRDQTIPGMLTQLNTLASDVATSFNAAQAQGFDANGNKGQNFFTVPTNSADAASGLSVAITDPTEVAASSDGTSGSNGNIANLSAAVNGTMSSGSTPADAYASLVYQVGSSASSASAESSAIGMSLQQLTDQQSSVSAVNTNEEATNLLLYQTSYEAAARVIATVQQLTVDAMAMVGGS
jgi:flagellar hook-associated protein 1